MVRMRLAANRFLAPLGFLLALSAAGCGGGAPDIVVSNVDDSSQIVKLSSLKGKVVVIDFWATWCGPCKMTMPSVQKLYNDYSAKGVQFMGISDDEPSKVKQYRADNNVSYPMFYDQDDIASQMFGVEGIPHLVVIDKNGKEAQVEEGAPLNEQEVREAIDKCLAG